MPNENTISITEIHQEPLENGVLIWGAGQNQKGEKRWASHLKQNTDDWTTAFEECQKRIIEMFYPKTKIETDEPIKTEKSPEPPTKIPVERLKSIINLNGVSLAKDDIPIKEKIKRWVNMLKWAFPLIPDHEKTFKSTVRKAIRNPSLWDFMEKPQSKRD